MIDIEIISQKKITKPKKVQVFELTFKENGKIKEREVIKELDIVKIVLFHKEKNALLLIKQFRPALYINHPNLGKRIELCGGRVDKKGKSIEAIALEEVIEETGYKPKKLEPITTVYEGGKRYFFYAEIDESMKVNDGGGIDEEDIELYFLSVEKINEFLYDDSMIKRTGTFLGLQWFYCNKVVNNG